MARIVSLTETPSENTSAHGTVDCGYRVFEEEGRSLVQLDTYGSRRRSLQGKVSQSIQLERQAAEQLVEILVATFPGICRSRSSTNPTRETNQPADQHGRGAVTRDRVAAELSRLIAIGARVDAIAEITGLSARSVRHELRQLSRQEWDAWNLRTRERHSTLLRDSYALTAQNATASDIRANLGLTMAESFRLAERTSDATKVIDLQRDGLAIEGIAKRTGLASNRVTRILAELNASEFEDPEQAGRGLTVEDPSVPGETTSDTVMAQHDLDDAGVDAADVVGMFDQILSVRDTAAAFKIMDRTVESVLAEAGVNYRDILMERRGRREQYSDAQLLSYLQIAADGLGTDTLTGPMYDDFAATQTLTVERWPSRQLFALRFGTWSQACDAAGIIPGTSHRKHAQQFPRATCVELLIIFNDLCDERGVRPTTARYSAAAADHADWPSIATIRTRFDGSWITAIRTARITRARRRAITEL